MRNTLHQKASYIFTLLIKAIFYRSFLWHAKLEMEWNGIKAFLKDTKTLSKRKKYLQWGYISCRKAIHANNGNIVNFV